MAEKLNSFSAQDALVAVMVASSMSDEVIRTTELLMIENLINHSPIFAEYDINNVRSIFNAVQELIKVDNGLDEFFDLVKKALPEKLNETAYVMACDVTAADGKLEQSELRFLEELSFRLSIDHLHVAAIEWAVRVRYMKV